MIRILTGLLLTMGAVGGLEMGTATMLQGILYSIAGLSLMAWPIIDGTVQEYE